MQYVITFHKCICRCNSIVQLYARGKWSRFYVLRTSVFTAMLLFQLYHETSVITPYSLLLTDNKNVVL